ncbi:MAG: peptide chain release factor N(5)-glutamine methyltransferase [Fuerstiella sp.]|nr:peptide chain release factor N(5)-glutamine methyltransferase [Fuerstiella sp.]
MNESGPADDVWTVQRILAWTTNYLTKNGIPAARLEAELLCAHARQCQRVRLYTDYDMPMTDTERVRMREYVQRRAGREPLAYITGNREFYGRNFEVGVGVLIPRPETETLVDLALEQISDIHASQFAEVGFGSGCIAVTLAVQKPKCRITASDISDVCFGYATRNATMYEVTDRIRLVRGNGLEPIKRSSTDVRYDGIISNPPYVCDHELQELQPEVAEYEPHDALLSGVDGLDLIRRLIPESSDILKPGGWIGLECDPAQCEEVRRLMTDSGFTKIKIHQDHRNVDRIVTAFKKGDASADK